VNFSLEIDKSSDSARNLQISSWVQGNCAELAANSRKDTGWPDSLKMRPLQIAGIRDSLSAALYKEGSALPNPQQAKRQSEQINEPGMRSAASYREQKTHIRSSHPSFPQGTTQASHSHLKSRRHLGLLLNNVKADSVS
jgi:hypothetical protein